MPYTDGFVLAIPKENLPAYRKMAKKAAAIWRELGALDYKEWVGDDMECDFGVPFPKAAKAKPGDVVIIAWIIYKDKAHRNRVNKLIMKDPRVAEMCDPKNPLFDVKRMVYGGFKSLVD